MSSLPALTGPRRRRSLRLLLALLVGCIALSGCDFNVYKLPLPGGAALGDHPITITADFTDVLDLVPKSSVKVNDINAGEITDISLDGQTAVVTMKIRGDTGLPADAIASIRQTSLLGEKFVSLEAPAGGGSGQLADGATIPLARTGRNPEVEEVLGALSLLLNGGGVAQLKTIADEVNKTLGGREEAARSVLTQIADLTGQLNAHRGDIVAAIDSLNGLAVSVKAQQRSIDAALDELPSALDSLNGQRADLVKMLKSLDHLSNVGVRVIQASKAATFASLRQLRPVLTQLANSGNAFVDSINASLTYPFVDEVVGRDPQVARNLQMGDYTNLSVNLDVNLTQPLTTPGVPGLPGTPGLPCTTLNQLPGNLPLNQLLHLSNLCKGVQSALSKCADHPSVNNCKGLPTAVIGAVCDTLQPGLFKRLCGKKGTKPSGPGLPGVPGLPGLPNLPGVGGLGTSLNTGLSSPRAPFTATSGGTGKGRATGHGPTMGQLMQVYDPALVSLLTPGMVLR